MFIIEEVLLKEMLLKMEKLVEAFPQEIQMVKDNCKKYYESELKKHQYARAKAYELFKFHGMFQSNDYIEIKKFLCKCYDMRSYHQANAFWNLIQDNNWDQMDNITKQPLTEQIRQFLSINDAFFWKSSDRNYTKPETNN